MRLEHGELAAEHFLGLPRLALLLGSRRRTRSRQARVERRLARARDGLVGLAEELPPLGVADERAVDAELEQHRRARSRP